MKQLNRILTLLLLMLTCATHAQVIYPSNVTTTLTSPYSIYLDEYSNPLTPKIKANIVFTDFTEASWDVYLKLKITGSNFTIESKPAIKPPQPVNVIPGVPFQLSGADLDWYFNNNNLIFSGITRAKLESTNNRLPEGFYTFCFEVIDYVTDRKISLPNCVSAYLSLNDPPLVIAPVCGNAIESTTQQNILFQWQISNTNGSLNVSTLNYLFLTGVNTSEADNLFITKQCELKDDTLRLWLHYTLDSVWIIKQGIDQHNFDQMLTSFGLKSSKTFNEIVSLSGNGVEQIAGVLYTLGDWISKANNLKMPAE